MAGPWRQSALRAFAGDLRDRAQAQVECSSPNPDGSYAVPEGWELIPAGVSPGRKFRLLFAISTARRPDSSDIAVYNTYVTSILDQIKRSL